MKILNSVKAAWSDEYTEELNNLPKSSPLCIIFPFRQNRGNFSSENYHKFSTSKLVTKDDIAETMIMLKEAHGGLEPTSPGFKKCLLACSVIGANTIIFGFLLLAGLHQIKLPGGKMKTVFEVQLVPLILGIILSVGLTIFIHILLGRKFLLRDNKAIKNRNFELEKALNYQNQKLFNRLGYSWELSEMGSYLKLNLSLRRVHTSTVKNLKHSSSNKDLEDLSVIREESTTRQ